MSRSELSEKLCETLEPEDCVVQTIPEASPRKWHLAHTSWFFETFVLKAALPNYKPINAQYAYLFNSYYNSAGKMHCRPKRGLISRPTLSETLEYRHRVDALMEGILENEDLLKQFAPIIGLGINHEQQHQELMLTDIKHVFSENPLRPIFRERRRNNGLHSSSDRVGAIPGGSLSDRARWRWIFLRQRRAASSAVC